MNTQGILSLLSSQNLSENEINSSNGILQFIKNAKTYIDNNFIDSNPSPNKHCIKSFDDGVEIYKYNDHIAFYEIKDKEKRLEVGYNSDEQWRLNIKFKELSNDKPIAFGEFLNDNPEDKRNADIECKIFPNDVYFWFATSEGSIGYWKSPCIDGIGIEETKRFQFPSYDVLNSELNATLKQAKTMFLDFMKDKISQEELNNILQSDFTSKEEKNYRQII